MRAEGVSPRTSIARPAGESKIVETSLDGYGFEMRVDHPPHPIALAVGRGAKRWLPANSNSATLWPLTGYEPGYTAVVLVLGRNESASLTAWRAGFRGSRRGLWVPPRVACEGVPPACSAARSVNSRSMCRRRAATSPALAALADAALASSVLNSLTRSRSWLSFSTVLQASLNAASSSKSSVFHLSRFMVAKTPHYSPHPRNC